jgi:hypothetical protein
VSAKTFHGESTLRMTLLGIGAMASPRYRPAGILVEYAKVRVMIDGGPGARSCTARSTLAAR